MSDFFPLSIEADRVRPVTPEYGLLRGECWTTVPLPPPSRRYIQKKLFCWRSRRLASECTGERSHSVLDEHSTKETPTVERRIRTSQLAPLHERITVGHELGPTRRDETQPYAIIRSMHACELDRGGLIKYALARRPKYICGRHDDQCRDACRQRGRRVAALPWCFPPGAGFPCPSSHPTIWPCCPDCRSECEIPRVAADLEEK